jgi:glycosyltransferase involved in cell wall biosynthesis
LRILYSHRIQSRDGQSVHLEALVAAFRGAGHEVLVVGPGLYQGVGFGGESRLVDLVRRRLPHAVAECAEILYNIPAYWRLRRSYKEFRPDFVYERYNLYYLAGMLLSRRYRVPFFLEINAPLADERARFGGLGLVRLARALEGLVWRSADRVLVVTAVLGEMVAAAAVRPERLRVIANGIDPQAFPDEPYRPRPGEPVTIGFVGFVRDWHGLDKVIAGLAAEKSDPPIRLMIVGDGPARDALERQAEALGVAERVEFTGLQSRPVVRDLLRRFDIALQPQAVSYASPLKIFEYMACGLPIVAPDQPNIREILSNGETAILFDPDSPDAMWNAIRRLAGDPRLREELGRTARAALDANGYTWQGNAAKIVGMAKEILAARAIRPAA